MIKFALVFSLLFIGAFQAPLGQNPRISRINKDIERVTLNPEFNKRGASALFGNEQSPKKFGVRNIKKADYTPTVYENPVQLAFILCPTEEVCWGVDTSHQVYRTTDSMMHWNVVSSIPVSAQIYAVHISPADHNSIFFLGTGTTAFVSSDGGQSYKQITTNTYVEGLILHPNVTKFMIGNDGHDGLLYSEDFGTTWTLMRTNVFDYDFCNGAILSSIPRICMIAAVGSINKLIRTEDWGMTVTELLPASVDYIVSHPRFTFVIGNRINSTQKTVYISSSKGEIFKEILLPRNLNVPFFAPDQILDDRGGAIWIGVNHDASQFWGLHDGSIYVGDGTGYRFTEAFPHAATKNNWWDFDAIKSIEGSYIANMLLTWETDVPGGDTNENDQEIKTYITYDSGDHWRPLPAPTVDVYGQPIQCTGTCSLNLFGKTTWLGVGGYGFYGDFFTSEKAVGLIIGTGNTGDNLLYRASDVNTYFSTDAGFSWNMVAEGSTVYEFGDMGGIMVMAHNQVPTNTMYYSVDQGQSWTAFNFTSTPVIIVNIYSTSDTYGRFVIFSVRNNQVVYFGIDFENVPLRVCNPDDFEDWELQRHECELGRETIYNRRRKTSICKHPDDYKPVKSVRNCNCNENDYECDEGFELSQFSGKCVKVDESTPPCGPDGTYTQSSGYRLIPDDSCINPLEDYAPVVVPCEDHHPIIHTSKGVIAAIALVCLVVIAAAVFIGFLVGLRNQGFRTKLQSFMRIPTKEDGAIHSEGYSNQIQMIDDD